MDTTSEIEQNERPYIKSFECSQDLYKKVKRFIIIREILLYVIGLAAIVMWHYANGILSMLCFIIFILAGLKHGMMGKLSSHASAKISIINGFIYFSAKDEIICARSKRLLLEYKICSISRIKETTEYYVFTGTFEKKIDGNDAKPVTQLKIPKVFEPEVIEMIKSRYHIYD